MQCQPVIRIAQYNELTRIHDRLAPHLLYAVPAVLHHLVHVDRTSAVVVALVLGLDLTVVDPVPVLQCLKRLLHLLLSRDQQQFAVDGYRAYLIPRTNLRRFDNSIRVMSIRPSTQLARRANTR